MARITSKWAAAHENPQGPGDARPTALQVIQEEGLIDGMKDKVFLVTGANDTTGLETARALHMTGARVFITTRSEEKSAKSVKSIIESNGGVKGGIEAITMELADLNSVRSAAKEFLSKSDKLNALICNAGTFPSTKQHTAQGFEACFGVNHIGHFVLFQELKDILLKSSTPSFNSRLVMVASIGHRCSEINFDDPNFEHREWDQVRAYAQSKTANIYMANYVDKVYGPQGLHAWSLQPGGIDSNLWITSDEMRAAVHSNDTYRPYLKNTAQGAATQVWAAVAKELEGKGGKYLESMQEIGEWPGPEERRQDWTCSGYSPFIYDQEKADRLWKLTEELVAKV
ncbi:WW domain-containing oxidoreductase [Xylogone sp. PMI_703]|nr:WW domain-containing oxidoreductase [Xylogone sp. PMI_703]